MYFFFKIEFDKYYISSYNMCVMCMKSLPNIELTEEQYHYMIRRKFDYGSESILYSEPSIFGSNTVAKIYNTKNEQIIQNKHEKLKGMYQLEKLKEINDIQILKSISYQRKIIGSLYSRTCYRDFNQISMKKSEILQVLIQIRYKLQQLESMDILYGDISGSNVMIYQNQICFCDLDNVAYQDYPMDLMVEQLIEFITNYGKFDAKAVSYMFNFFALKKLCFFEENKQVEEYLELMSIPREFKPKPYLYITEQMRIVTPYYKGYYLTDYVKQKNYSKN